MAPQLEFFERAPPLPTTRTLALRIKTHGAGAAIDEAQRRADAARYQEITCRSALNRGQGHAVQLDAESLSRLHPRLPLLLRAALPDTVRARARRPLLVVHPRQDEPRRGAAARARSGRRGRGSRWRSAPRPIRISRSKATTSSRAVRSKRWWRPARRSVSSPRDRWWSAISICSPSSAGGADCTRLHERADGGRRARGARSSPERRIRCSGCARSARCATPASTPAC